MRKKNREAEYQKAKVRWDSFYRGSLLGKVSQVVFLGLFIFGIFQLITLHWIFGFSCIILSIVSAYISYHCAGGKRNPAIWEGKDMYDMLSALTRKERYIGFHHFENPWQVLTRLKSMGITKKPSESDRRFILRNILRKRNVFNVCRDYIIVEALHNGKLYHWDGYGKRRDIQFFGEAEIIFTLEPAVGSVFVEVLEERVNDNEE